MKLKHFFLNEGPGLDSFEHDDAGGIRSQQNAEKTVDEWLAYGKLHMLFDAALKLCELESHSREVDANEKMIMRKMATIIRAVVKPLKELEDQ